MDLFRYDEQDGKKYLIYEKREKDVLDTFTMEMLSNNRIEGIVPFSYIQIDHEIHMKYNVTGLKSMMELFSGKINRKTILNILGSMADAVLKAEDYMLESSSYLFDESFIYVDTENMKVSMVVLPLERSGEKPENFLKRLLFDIPYDESEDCSYVAELVSFLGSGKSFSMQSFREQISEMKHRRMQEKKEPVKNAILGEKSGEARRDIYTPPMRAGRRDEDMTAFIPQTEKEKLSVKPDTAKKGGKSHLKNSEDLIGKMDVIYSDMSEEEPEGKRFGIFGKKEKGEKKLLFGKKQEKKSGVLSGATGKMPLAGLKIPGMDLPGKILNQEQEEKKADRIDMPVKQISIPAQKVEIRCQENLEMDFGDTVNIETYDDKDETLMLHPEPEQPEKPHPGEIPVRQEHPRQRFLLHRCRTDENFEIRGDIVRVGRSSSVSDICIPGNPGIGRIHVVLYVRDGQVFIADNGSKNKTFVDGTELKPEDPPMLLLSGSKIKMSDEEFEFRISR